MADNLDGNIRDTREIRVTALDLDQKPHDRRDIDLLYRIYLDKRVRAQTSFYQSRIKENERNADFTFSAGALVLTVSSLIATISATSPQPVLSLLSTILPAVAAMLASFRQLYAWERQANLYRDTLLGLERVKLLAPDNDRVAAMDLMQIYPQLVTSSETIFTGEVSQWGQFVAEKDKEGLEQGDRALQDMIRDLDLTDEQRATIQAIMQAGKKTEVVKSTDAVVKTELPAEVGGGGTIVAEIHTTHQAEAAGHETKDTSVSMSSDDGTPVEIHVEQPSDAEILSAEGQANGASEELPEEEQPEESQGAVG